MKERLNPACWQLLGGWGVCNTSVRAAVWTYSLLLLWQSELCVGRIEVVGLSVRQSGGEVPASSVRGLQSAVHGLRRAVKLQRTTDGSADAGAAGAPWMFCAPVKSRAQAVDIRYANEAGSKIWCP